MYFFRAEAAEMLRDGPMALKLWLRRHYRLTSPAIDELADYLLQQETVSEIPDERTLLIEGVMHDAGIEYALHTPLPRAANEALARVIGLRLERDWDRHAETLAADLGVLLYVRGTNPLAAPTWRTMLAIERWDEDFRTALDDSWLLRERFAAVAMTGLMLLRHPMGGRRKVGGGDWAERRLFDQVRAADPEFVLLRQAERETAHDVCDCTAALNFLREMPRLLICCRWLNEPSPFAAGWMNASLQRGGTPGIAAAVG
jgi:ATP-dependent Lhr-like helicase